MHDKREWPITVGIFGIDGCGKTTQIGLVKNEFLAQGFFVETPTVNSKLRSEAHRIAHGMGYDSGYGLYDVPTLNFASALDYYLELQNLLYGSASKRLILFDKYVEALRAKEVIHCGRVSQQTSLIYEVYPKLDIVFFLRIKSEEAVERIRIRNGSAIGNESPDYLSSYAEAYESCLPEGTIVIDATLAAKEIAQKIAMLISQKIRSTEEETSNDYVR